jgi:SAM-dependent methyltransferase
MSVLKKGTNVPERTTKSITGLEAMCQYIMDIACGSIRVAEIGCWTGAGTAVFAKYFPFVYAVDPWDSGAGEIAGEFDMAVIEAMFDARHGKNDCIKKMKMRSLEAARTFEDRRLDVVYIDALHAYLPCAQDIAAWRGKVRPGGFICGHDYSQKKFPGVYRAVNEAFKGQVKTFSDTSWAVRV